MIDFNKCIETKNLDLRPMIYQDWELMEPLTKDPNMWIFFTHDLSETSNLKEWVANAILEHEYQKSLPFTILHKECKEFVGTTRISNISERDKRLEIGWTWIARTHQGTGLNQEVKKHLFDYLFNETKVERIELKTDVLNTPAIKGMLKAGLVQEGILRSHTLMTHQRRRDTLYFSILRSEWEQTL